MLRLLSCVQKTLPVLAMLFLVLGGGYSSVAFANPKVDFLRTILKKDDGGSQQSPLITREMLEQHDAAIAKFMAFTLAGEELMKLVETVRKAAEVGVAAAQMNMGLFNEFGLAPGGIPNFQDALKWYLLAEYNGVKDATIRKEIAVSRLNKTQQKNARQDAEITSERLTIQQWLVSY
ncbi:MAG: hypothetical protein ACOYK8_05870 [Alphaproteobacteria bacterium]